ncbi:MAG: patatin-like phospholipase family protein [Gammaproteobacteria bacterium]
MSRGYEIVLPPSGSGITVGPGDKLVPWTRAHRQGIPCTLCLDHVLASASLPLFFPAVNIGGCWYGDGGIRMTAPLSPAVHLGADRILAISTKYAPSSEEADCPNINGYPPPVQVVGALYNALFDVWRVVLASRRLDRLDDHSNIDPRVQHLYAFYHST